MPERPQPPRKPVPKKPVPKKMASKTSKRASWAWRRSGTGRTALPYWLTSTEEAANTSFGTMVRRLPKLLGEAWLLAWRADPFTTASVAVLQIAGGAASALGLLICDEPTANLDARAEHDVYQRLRELVAGRTVVLITHRMASVRDADRIYVLDHGAIVEEGDHASLMAAGGIYAQLFTLQASAYQSA